MDNNRDNLWSQRYDIHRNTLTGSSNTSLISNNNNIQDDLRVGIWNDDDINDIQNRYHYNERLDSSNNQYNSMYYDTTGNYQNMSPNYFPTRNNSNNNDTYQIQQQSSLSSQQASQQQIASDNLVARTAHETRHARRLYVGGIPSGQTSEEHLRTYLNEVISRCLGEDNNNSYIVSIYMNHKKCFAFVELKSIELTNACLELDGIIYCSSVLRIQRANEYKPELVGALPPSRPPIKFNLSKAPFLENSLPISKDYKRPAEPDPIPVSLIRPCGIADVIPGCIAIVGFPYDEGARRSNMPVGSATAPGVLRYYLGKLLQSNMNTEFGVDLTNITILDVGDVPFGLSLEEALSRLNDAIVELIRRGAIPIIIGGSQDQSYPITGGLMDVVGGGIGVVNINSRLSVNQLSVEMKIEAASANRLLLSDSRFCPPRESYTVHEPSCEGKLVIYGAQGAYCSPEHVNFLQKRGGHIIWLSKDIRRQSLFGIEKANDPTSRRTSDSSAADENTDTQQIAAKQFLNSSYNEEEEDENNFFTATSTQSILTRQSLPSIPYSSQNIPVQFPKLLQYMSSTPMSVSLVNRPIYVSFSLYSMQDLASPGMSLRSPQGFTSEEAMILCRQSGLDSNVHIFDIHGFNPTIEETRTGSLVAEMIYNFLLGFSQRRHIYNRNQARLGQYIARNHNRSPVDSKSSNSIVL